MIFFTLEFKNLVNEKNSDLEKLLKKFGLNFNASYDDLEDKINSYFNIDNIDYEVEHILNIYQYDEDNKEDSQYANSNDKKEFSSSDV